LDLEASYFNSKNYRTIISSINIQDCAPAPSCHLGTVFIFFNLILI